MEILFLCLTALTLGLRHGLDIDHLAAMLDMAGTSVTEDARPKGTRLSGLLHATKLPAFYVFGHALMVVMLGLTALAFGSIIPEWVDDVMERIVGVTLLLLSLYLFYSLGMFMVKGKELKLRSRWMVLFAVVGNSWHWLISRVFKHHHHHKHEPLNWDSKGSFLIGMIHGFGAETGTQVLLFASVVGSGSLSVGLCLLSAWVIGMTISTLGMAVCISAGLTSSTYFKPLLFVLGVMAAVFSLIVGVYFTFGVSGLLPSL